MASPYSTSLPKLQIAWDATSLGQLMFCPRSYQLAIQEGWRKPENIHLEFGGHVARCKETFRRARLAGRSLREAQCDTLGYALGATWGWSGSYEEQWRCTGTEPYRNRKGNRAKCPWSHAGKWFPGTAPDTCGECGSGCEVQRRWVTDHPDKDRYALMRLLCWWLDDQPEDPTEAFHNVRIGGVDAVELSWTMPTPWQAETGETFLLCGHMDTIGCLGSEHYIADDKTTKMWLSDAYWSQYSPNIQVDLYDLAGSVLYPELNIKGVLIEAAQTTKDNTKFGMMAFYRTPMQREELMMDLKLWLSQAEYYATADYWPMNRKSCPMCQFKEVCALEPHKRAEALSLSYVQKFWNPLETR